jgi:hypothetical protein
LDRAGEFQPGHGNLELYGYVTPDAAGGGLDYAHRITGGLSAFAKGWGGMARDPFGHWEPDYGALGGLRWRW